MRHMPCGSRPALSLTPSKAVSKTDLSLTPFALVSDWSILPDTVSLPNYTGSVGYGENYIQEILGKWGVLDVADCTATVEELIRLGVSKSGRQVIQGGSHGGFLAAHRKSSPSQANSTGFIEDPAVIG